MAKLPLMLMVSVISTAVIPLTVAAGSPDKAEKEARKAQKAALKEQARQQRAARKEERRQHSAEAPERRQPVEVTREGVLVTPEALPEKYQVLMDIERDAKRVKEVLQQPQ